MVRKTVVPSPLSAATSSQIVLAADRVEAGGRLVEEEHLRLVDERRRKVETPAHAARVGADAAVGGTGEADALDQGGAAPLRFGADQAVQRGLKANQLVAGHQRVQRGLLKRDPDRAANVSGLADHVVPGDPGAAARGAQERGQHPHRRGLACAVGTQKRIDLAGLDLEVDTVHSSQTPREFTLEP